MTVGDVRLTVRSDDWQFCLNAMQSLIDITCPRPVRKNDNVTTLAMSSKQAASTMAFFLTRVVSLLLLGTFESLQLLGACRMPGTLAKGEKKTYTYFFFALPFYTAGIRSGLACT